MPQSEADRLLTCAKIFDQGPETIELPRQLSFDLEYTLKSSDGHEQFQLDLERGRKKRIRLKYQTRAKKIYVLARLDIDGRPHRNPPDAPHRPNERFTGNHVHLYREGFGDRVAFHPEEVVGLETPEDDSHISWLISFLGLCGVKNTPFIQDGI